LTNSKSTTSTKTWLIEPALGVFVERKTPNKRKKIGSESERAVMGVIKNYSVLS